MAEKTSSAHIVTDPHTLLGVSRAISERIAPPAGRQGFDALRQIEQLRLLFIDSLQGLFVFSAPDAAARLRANRQARPVLEKALEEIFEEKVRVELVVFDENRVSLSALIQELTGISLSGSQDMPVESVESSTEHETRQERAGRKAPNFNKVQLGLIQNNLRSVFTSPNRVVVVPGYLLRWIPYLGPLRASIVVACFQAFYLCKGTTARAEAGLGPSSSFEAPGPFLAAVAGIAESSVWRHLDDPELGWFLKKVPYQPDEKRWIRDEKAGLTKKRPSRFLFRSIAPLTPGDAQALKAYLLDLNIREDPVGLLTELTRGEYRLEPRDVFPFPPPPPPKDWQLGDPDGCLAHNILYAAIGVSAKTASRELTALVDELVERLLPANDQLHLSWYFLLHWQPLLGHGPGWATILLRDRCFYNRQTGELRDTVTVRGGYQELAEALGLQRLKTVREWFPAPHAQKEAIKSADLASRQALVQIAQSKRGFVKEYAAKFIELVEAEADGRGQVASFKAQVKLFDPLTPLHEALYNRLFPLAQAYFNLPQACKVAFLNAFDITADLQASSIEWIIQETGEAVAQIVHAYGSAVQPGSAWEPTKLAVNHFLGAIERITNEDMGAFRRFTHQDPGAIERIDADDAGAFEKIAPFDLGGFESLTALLSGAFARLTVADPGAFEKIGLVFWAQMRGLKHLVLNNHLGIALKSYFQNTDLENTENISTTTTPENHDQQTASDQGVEVERYPHIGNWDLNKLLDNFSPNMKRELLERGVTIAAVLSCLVYIASSKGDNLGLGYVVEKLKARPREGQGGIYYRLAENEPQDMLAKLRSYLEYRSFQSRDWRVAMGTPTTEKILELLEHLGFDSSQFESRWY